MKLGPDMPLLAQRAYLRAADAARDASECIIAGRIDDARTLLAEAVRDLDAADKRAAGN